MPKFTVECMECGRKRVRSGESGFDAIATFDEKKKHPVTKTKGVYVTTPCPECGDIDMRATSR